MIRTLGLRGTPQGHPIEPTTSFAGFAGAVGMDVAWNELGAVQLANKDHCVNILSPSGFWLIAWDEDDIEVMTLSAFHRRFEVTGHVPAS